MAVKITQSTLVGSLHPEGGTVVGAVRAALSFAPQPHKPLCSAHESCAHKYDTIWVAVTAAPGGGTLHFHSPRNNVSEIPEQQRLLQRYNEII